MSKEERLKQILSIPFESRTLEFKRLGTRNETLDKVLQSIVAMANTDGGVIVLGVDDPQKTTAKGLDRVFGIEENLELYDELGRSVKKISPPISSIWPPELIDISDKKVRTKTRKKPIRSGFIREAHPCSHFYRFSPYSFVFFSQPYKLLELLEGYQF